MDSAELGVLAALVLAIVVAAVVLVLAADAFAKFVNRRRDRAKARRLAESAQRITARGVEPQFFKERPNPSWKAAPKLPPVVAHPVDVPRVESSDGSLVEGIVIGAMLAGRGDETQSAPEREAPAPERGGEFGGGGASESFDSGGSASC